MERSGTKQRMWCSWSSAPPRSRHAVSGATLRCNHVMEARERTPGRGGALREAQLWRRGERRWAAGRPAGALEDAAALLRTSRRALLTSWRRPGGARLGGAALREAQRRWRGRWCSAGGSCAAEPQGAAAPFSTSHRGNITPWSRAGVLGGGAARCGRCTGALVCVHAGRGCGEQLRALCMPRRRAARRGALSQDPGGAPA
jgi:hypothetical protein